jgi:dual specificity phosphatase 12
MEPFLENGNMAGKILCPNEKCKAKIGNYDWAGVQCGCKEWVVPVSLVST